MKIKEKFDESANFDVVPKVSHESVSVCGENRESLTGGRSIAQQMSDDYKKSLEEPREAVSDYEISQHSADEVIHPKADEWDEIGRIEGGQIERELEAISIVSQDKPQEWVAPEGFQLVSEVAIKYLHDEWPSAYPKFYELVDKSVRQVAIDEALEVFTGMISPSENQLGVLYDAGYLLTKKDD